MDQDQEAYRSHLSVMYKCVNNPGHRYPNNFPDGFCPSSECSGIGYLINEDSKLPGPPIVNGARPPANAKVSTAPKPAPGSRPGNTPAPGRSSVSPTIPKFKVSASTVPGAAALPNIPVTKVPAPTPSIVNPIPPIAKMIGGFLALVFLCVIGSGVVGFLGNLVGPKPSPTPNPSIGGNPSPTINSSPELPASFSRSYQGTIGGMDFSMSLNRNGSKLEGKASTESSWDKLSGTIESNGEFTVKGLEFGSKYTGIYKGTIYSNGTISGTWTRPDGTSETSFYVSQN